MTSTKLSNFAALVLTLAFALTALFPASSFATPPGLFEEYGDGGRHFEKIEVGYMLVYFHQRTIGEATVEKDYIVYQLDKDTGALLARKNHWRDDLPAALPRALISREQAEGLVEGEIQFSGLYIISPESDVFPLSPTPENPCWAVRSVGGHGEYVVTIIDAVKGVILGKGVPPPYTAFSLTGPWYFYPCDGAWSSWSQNAEEWFNEMGYSTEEVEWPTQTKVQSHIQSSETAMFYELAHGGSYSFASGCVGGNDAEDTTAAEIEAWMVGYEKMPFAFIGSCLGMCSTGNNTFAYEFRKGSTQNTTVVGYCGMSEPQCEDCWGYSIDWQDTLFYYMDLGYAVRDAYDQANASQPACAIGNCMRFAGDEDFTVVPPVLRDGTPLWIILPGGVPRYIPPDVPTSITVEIVDGIEQYVPDTGTLYYRYDGGEWQTDLLEPLAGDLYEATLMPPDCNASPEYYFSAEGHLGSVVFKPANAPATTYSSGVGELVPTFTDDFETDQGWYVQNDADLTEGAWERGIPVDCDRGDPPTDYDGSGRCYLTMNDPDDCNSDVDGGYTRLISPTFDMSTGDAKVHYALWYTNDYAGNPNEDEFKVHVSNNNGANWTLVKTIGPQSPPEEWIERSFWVGDHVTPTNQVKVRFEASDFIGLSIVEAGLDDFSVSTYECTMPEIVPPLPENSLGIPCVDDSECDITNEAKCVQGVCYAPKQRYLSIARNPEQIDASTARRIKLDNGTVLGWVGQPEEVGGGLCICRVQQTPFYVDWGNLLGPGPCMGATVVHVSDCQVATNQTYCIQAIALGQDTGDENSYSEVLELHTPSTWGDTVTSGPGGLLLPPDGVPGLADIMAAIAYFQGDTTNAPLTWLDIAPSTGDDSPDQVVGLGDIMGAIAGFQGDPYPGDGPLDCP